jgi:hypothetical protein
MKTFFTVPMFPPLLVGLFVFLAITLRGPPRMKGIAFSEALILLSTSTTERIADPAYVPFSTTSSGSIHAPNDQHTLPHRAL